MFCLGGGLLLAVNLAMVKRVAELLGPLLPKVVFLGGAATGFLITDEAAPEGMPSLVPPAFAPRLNSS